MAPASAQLHCIRLRLVAMSSLSVGLGRPSSGKASSRHPRQSSGAYQVFDPAQVQTFREAFTFFDQDNDGLISEEDLKGLLTSLGLPVDPTRIRALLSSTPSSSSSSLSPSAPLQPMNFTTFVTLLAQHLSSFDPEPDLLEAFASFDEGNTGFVKAEEVRPFLRDLGPEALSEDEIARFLSPPFLDARTGLFDYRKFCAHLRVTEPGEEEQAALAGQAVAA
ncbi:hypothetical protein JCM8097_000940 [Rhodosporidiobolus ruineniae]